MSLNRLIRYLNVLIAFFLLLAALTFYWFAFRVLPQTKGTTFAPIAKEAAITRDKLGVPHIVAGTVEDALFLQGFVTAQDRLWQMDALRRFASGELSEIIGPKTLDADRETRRLRVRRIAEQHVRTLAPAERHHLSAYARGVNHFLETHRDALPLEFTLLNYQPRPWSQVDCILAGLHMFRDLSTTWRDEVQKRRLLQGARPDLVSALYPVRGGREFQPGSNAWALSGKHTASGKPLLANDPHLEFSIPSTWYMVHLKAPGLNVTGASLPGLPSVIIGHNERIAWGVTNLHFDVQDLYIERMNRQTGQYVFQGKVEQARLEREMIPVKGERPREFVSWVTRHGPLWSNQGTETLALKWVAAQPGVFEFPFVELNMARDWTQFRAALSRFPGPGQNFVYADADGNIGYQAAGKLPIRATYDGDLPVDGSSGAFEWQGVIPFDQLPKAFNPPSGAIITANQNPFPPDYAYRVNGNFAPSYRSRQIQSLLAARRRWRPVDMLAVQKDVYSAFSHYLARQTVAAFDRSRKRDALTESGAGLLRSWNGQMEKGQAAPLLAVILEAHLRRAIADRASPGRGLEYEYSFAREAVERLVRQRSPEWFPDWDKVLLTSLREAVEEGRRAQGRNLAKWDYGVYLELKLNQPVGSQIPIVGPYFNIGPIPMSGSGATVKQTTRRLGPSMRFVADAGNWDRSLQNITVGQSGQFLSSHYKDQWDSYYAGKSFQQQFHNPQGDVLRVRPLGR